MRTDLDIKSKVLVPKCKADIISVELNLGDNKIIVICDCYRVGNLGEENFTEIEKHILSISRKKKYKRHLLVGDFNLANIPWEHGHGETTCGMENKFLGFFDDVGFNQYIDRPTHIGGKILDLVLSNTNSLVSNLRVLPKYTGVKSDHFAIEFDIAVKAKRVKTKKRKILNFKKANWRAMNADLRRINWDRLLKYCEPEVAWNRFKHTIHSACERNIPYVAIKSDFKPPWFDFDVHKACLEKEKDRAKYVRTSKPEHYQAFEDSRKICKRLVEKKMHDNIMDDDDSALLSKKFWPYVKSSSNNHRIPETVNYGHRFRNNPKYQSELFNELFYDQFSDASNYDIPVDWIDDD